MAYLSIAERERLRGKSAGFDFFTRYVEGGRFWFPGDYVVYTTATGRLFSRSSWMVPGTWCGED